MLVFFWKAYFVLLVLFTLVSLLDLLLHLPRSTFGLGSHEDFMFRVRNVTAGAIMLAVWSFASPDASWPLRGIASALADSRKVFALFSLGVFVLAVTTAVHVSATVCVRKGWGYAAGTAMCLPLTILLTHVASAVVHGLRTAAGL